MNLKLDDVLHDVEFFLGKNPTEVVMVSIKNENSSNQGFDSLILKLSSNSNLWYKNPSIPKMSSVRGKIVLINRYGGNYGIRLRGWNDNTSYQEVGIRNSYYKVRVQDHYKVTKSFRQKAEDKKFVYIQNMFQSSIQNTSSRYLYLNFTSGYVPVFRVIPNIKDLSNKVTPKVIHAMQGIQKGDVGIVISDFTSATLSQSIIETNF